jgi:hypothetical protein
MKRVSRIRELKRLSKFPLGDDCYGWHKYYVEVFNKTGRSQAEHLAVWYLLLHFMHEGEAV